MTNASNEDYQLIHFDINGARPSYSISSSTAEDRGFEETLRLMINVIPLDGFPPVPDDFCMIEINGLRDLESTEIKVEPDSSPGLGLVTATTGGLVIQTIMPADVIWQLTSAIEDERFTSVFVRCDPIESVGDQAYLRGLDFRPG